VDTSDLAAWRDALVPAQVPCYRHCSTSARVRSFRVGRKNFEVYACPDGVVSLTMVWTDGRSRIPIGDLTRSLEQRTRPPELVVRRDLRTAARHGPELGRAVERRLGARSGPAVPIVYWRVYPARRGRYWARLLACFKHGPDEVRFFRDIPRAGRWRCPYCAETTAQGRRPTRRPAGERLGPT
jgi:hypothetical protein